VDSGSDGSGSDRAGAVYKTATSVAGCAVAVSRVRLSGNE